MKAENHHSEVREIQGVKISVTSYQIGARYFCHVANLDPGATIARGQGESREEAEEAALSKATRRLPETSPPLADTVSE